MKHIHETWHLIFDELAKEKGLEINDNELNNDILSLKWAYSRDGFDIFLFIINKASFDLEIGLLTKLYPNENSIDIFRVKYGLTDKERTELKQLKADGHEFIFNMYRAQKVLKNEWDNILVLASDLNS